MRKVIFCWFLLFLILSCRPSEKEISIGLLTSESGKYSPLLSSGVKGTVLAAEEINEAGRVHIKLLIMDNESRVDMTVEKARNLINKDPAAVLCNITSGAYAAVEEIFNSEKMLALSPTASSMEFSKKDDYLIRTTSGIEPNMIILSGLMMDMGLKNIAVTFDDGNMSYARSIIRLMEEELRLHSYRYKVQRFPFTSMNDPDFSEICSSIAESAPDGLLIIASPLDTALAAQYISIYAEGLPLFTSPWGVSAELIQHGGKSIEGMHIVNVDTGYLDTAEYGEFKKKFRRRFGEDPSYQSVLNYDTLNALVKVVKDTGSADTEKLRNAFLNIGSFEGIKGRYVIDEYGDCTLDVREYTIRDGEIVPVNRE